MTYIPVILPLLAAGHVAIETIMADRLFPIYLARVNTWPRTGDQTACGSKGKNSSPPAVRKKEQENEENSRLFGRGNTVPVSI